MGEEKQLSGLSSVVFVSVKNEDGSLGEPVKLEVADPPVWNGDAENKFKKSGFSISFDMDLVDRKSKEDEVARYEEYLQRLNGMLHDTRELTHLRSRMRKTLARRYVRELMALKEEYLLEMGHSTFNPYIYGRTNIPETIIRTVEILYVFIKGRGTIRTFRLFGSFLMPFEVRVRFKKRKIVPDVQESPRRSKEEYIEAIGNFLYKE